MNDEMEVSADDARPAMRGPAVGGRPVDWLEHVSDDQYVG